jgi:hypothetical protein
MDPQSIDFTKIMTWFFDATVPIIFGFIAEVIRSHLKNKRMAELLANAVVNSVGKAQRYGEKGIATWSPRVEATGLNPQMMTALQYVLDHAAEAVAYFQKRGQMSDGKIADKIDAQIGNKNIDSNIAVAASPAATPSPLAPLPDPILTTSSPPPTANFGGRPNGGPGIAPIPVVGIVT